METDWGHATSLTVPESSQNFLRRRLYDVLRQVRRFRRRQNVRLSRPRFQISRALERRKVLEGINQFSSGSWVLAHQPDRC